MRAKKQLINDNDFVKNPKGLFGDRLPIWYLDGTEDEYKHSRGGLNYGIFLATRLANKRFSPIINSLLTFLYDEDDTNRQDALNELKELTKEYYENQ